MQELAQTSNAVADLDMAQSLDTNISERAGSITINAMDPFSPALMYMWSCLLSLYTGDDTKALMARKTAEDFATIQFDKFQELQSSMAKAARDEDTLVSHPDESAVIGEDAEIGIDSPENNVNE